MADDDDSGESFMRKHMSEAQPSAYGGGFGDKRKDPSDYSVPSYGGDTSGLAKPNRGRKGDKL